MSQLADAPYAVAAHFRLRPVGIEHPHPHVSAAMPCVRRQAPRSNRRRRHRSAGQRSWGAKAAGISNGLLKPVDEHVVISDPMHFDKLHHRLSDHRCMGWGLYALAADQVSATITFVTNVGIIGAKPANAPATKDQTIAKQSVLPTLYHWPT